MRPPRRPDPAVRPRRPRRPAHRGEAAHHVGRAGHLCQLTDDDPIYGAALRKTWDWLQQEPVDFGPSRIQLTPGEQDELFSPTVRVPQLLPSHLDRWVQTSHLPDADPLPEFWLHGLRDAPPEVHLVWRADLPEKLLTGDSDDLIRLRTLIEACPPGAGEMLAVPLAAARRWLNSIPAGSVGDAVLDVEDPVDESGEQTWRPALVFDGDNTRVALHPRQMRRDTVLVVPAHYGGLTAGTWDPTATDPVSDLGTLAQPDRAPALRLSPELLNGPPVPDPQDPLSLAESRRALRAWLATADAGPEQHTGVYQAVKALRKANAGMRPMIVDRSSTEQRYVLRATSRGAGADSEPATSPFLGEPVFLAQHLRDVEQWALALGEACGLPDAVCADLALAAALHDLGKADPRFQRLLSAGEPTRPEPLAKSGLAAADHRGRRRAALASGYPSGTRHELTSVALVQDEPWLREQAHDLDLVLHLVASHHGYARPFLPVAEHAGPITVAVVHRGHTLSTASDHGLVSPSGGVPDRFWRCVRRYGWHGLAWLEALLRLADHRASEEGAPRPCSS